MPGIAQLANNFLFFYIPFPRRPLFFCAADPDRNFRRTPPRLFPRYRFVAIPCRNFSKTLTPFPFLVLSVTKSPPPSASGQDFFSVEYSDFWGSIFHPSELHPSPFLTLERLNTIIWSFPLSGPRPLFYYLVLS